LPFFSPQTAKLLKFASLTGFGGLLELLLDHYPKINHRETVLSVPSTHPAWLLAVMLLYRSLWMGSQPHGECAVAPPRQRGFEPWVRRVCHTFSTLNNTTGVPLMVSFFLLYKSLNTDCAAMLFGGGGHVEANSLHIALGKSVFGE
jgi:hypothetical protein